VDFYEAICAPGDYTNVEKSTWNSIEFISETLNCAEVRTCNIRQNLWISASTQLGRRH
jgi:hypothetical protein